MKTEEKKQEEKKSEEKKEIINLLEEAIREVIDSNTLKKDEKVGLVLFQNDEVILTILGKDFRKKYVIMKKDDMTYEVAYFYLSECDRILSNKNEEERDERVIDILLEVAENEFDLCGCSYYSNEILEDIIAIEISRRNRS